MTVIGHVDPVEVASKMRKPWGAQILTVGPAKEEKKEKKDDKDQIPDMIKHLYLSQYQTPYPMSCYYVDENPNSCVIC